MNELKSLIDLLSEGIYFLFWFLYKVFLNNIDVVFLFSVLFFRGFKFDFIFFFFICVLYSIDSLFKLGFFYLVLIIVFFFVIYIIVFFKICKLMNFMLLNIFYFCF